MSGHSKWANIKRKKEVNDKVKGTVFAKMSRLITLAVIEGGGAEPENNIRLRLAIDKAKLANMPKENIQRAILKGVGPNKSLIKEYIFEAFANGGVALIISTTSDNHNRTTSELRNMLDKSGAKLASQGSVAYLFNKCGLLTFNKSKNTEENVFKFAEKVNAIDIDQDEASFFIYIPFDNLGKYKIFLEGITDDSAEIDYKPTAMVEISEAGKVKALLTLIEALESLDDVHKVYGNFDIPDQYLN